MDIFSTIRIAAVVGLSVIKVVSIVLSVKEINGCGPINPFHYQTNNSQAYNYYNQQMCNNQPIFNNMPTQQFYQQPQPMPQQPMAINPNQYNNSRRNWYFNYNFSIPSSMQTQPNPMMYAQQPQQTPYAYYYQQPQPMPQQPNRSYPYQSQAVNSYPYQQSQISNMYNGSSRRNIGGYSNYSQQIPPVYPQYQQQSTMGMPQFQHSTQNPVNNKYSGIYGGKVVNENATFWNAPKNTNINNMNHMNNNVTPPNGGVVNQSSRRGGNWYQHQSNNNQQMQRPQPIPRRTSTTQQQSTMEVIVPEFLKPNNNPTEPQPQHHSQPIPQQPHTTQQKTESNQPVLNKTAEQWENEGIVAMFQSDDGKPLYGPCPSM